MDMYIIISMWQSQVEIEIIQLRILTALPHAKCCGAELSFKVYAGA